MKYTEDEIFKQIRTTMVELFELEETVVTPDAHLFEDLGLDSIDAVDLIVNLKKETGIKVKPEDFKSVRTVDDVVKTVKGLLTGNDA
jgi:acyl carrier protein